MQVFLTGFVLGGFHTASSLSDPPGCRYKYLIACARKDRFTTGLMKGSAPDVWEKMLNLTMVSKWYGCENPQQIINAFQALYLFISHFL